MLRGSRRSGRLNTGERRALWHYRLRGYRVLDRNAWAAGNELDLVLRRGQTLVFCEVKEKRGYGFGDPEEMVTAEKQRRLRRAATAWLAKHPEAEGLRVRFDVVAVAPQEIRRLVDAF